MGFFEIIGIITIIYYVINIILWIILDCDIELAFKEKFGQPISSLRGKVVWITGASSGIGRSLAISLAKRGVKLALSSRRREELEDVKLICLRESDGLLAMDDIFVIPFDMLVFDAHQICFEKIIDHFGRIDILVNNAGRSQRAKWEDIDIKVDKELFELDVFSVINLSRIVVKYFKTVCGGKGHIAITSSGAGLTPIPNSCSYSAAKHALHGYFSCLKIEEPTIDVTVFCPGPIATNFLQESFTEKPNEKYGIPVGDDDKRMTSERCGELFAVAISNKTMLSWVGLFPVSFLLYIVQYFPNIRIIVYKILGKKGIHKIREGH